MIIDNNTIEVGGRFEKLSGLTVGFDQLLRLVKSTNPFGLSDAELAKTKFTLEKNRFVLSPKFAASQINLPAHIELTELELVLNHFNLF